MRPSSPRNRVGGLRGQLLLGLVALLILTLALVAVATVQFHKRHLQQAVADEARRHAGWLAELDDSRARTEAVRALLAQPGVLHVGPPSDDLDDYLMDAPRVLLADFEDEPAIWAVADEASESLVILSLTDAQSAVDAARQAMVLYIAFTLLFVTLVGYAFFSFVVIRPLRALGVATERAAEGDLASPVTILPRNELGEVGRRFNRMLARLEDQQSELKDQIEQLRKAHEELQTTQESLIRSEKMASVGHLAAGVAHEVGNPLAAVMGYTDLLRDRSLDEETADDLADRMTRQLNRIRQIIRQLLDYSRTDSQKEPTSIDVEEQIREAVHLVRATPEARKVQIDIEIADDIAPARAITGELQQVLVNLLLNAVEAFEDDGTDRRVTIGADSDADSVIIDVCDTGPGIDEEIADQIFDPFFTTRSPGDGTGLGLAITERLISRVDGSLELLDAKTGAHFRVRLCRTAPHDESRPQGADTTDEATHS